MKEAVTTIVEKITQVRRDATDGFLVGLEKSGYVVHLQHNTAFTSLRGDITEGYVDQYYLTGKNRILNLFLSRTVDRANANPTWHKNQNGRRSGGNIF